MPVSIGDYLDRLTILELKVERAASAGAREAAHAVLDTWQQAHHDPIEADLVALIDDLRAVNGALWDAEDEIRSFMDCGDTDAVASVGAAIVRLNDRRSAVKREIDSCAGSAWTDVKNYRVDARDAATPGR